MHISVIIMQSLPEPLTCTLSDGRPRTLEEVGRAFNLDRDQIRRMEARVLKGLGHPTRSRWN